MYQKFIYLIKVFIKIFLVLPLFILSSPLVLFEMIDDISRCGKVIGGWGWKDLLAKNFKEYRAIYEVGGYFWVGMFLGLIILKIFKF